MIGKLRLLFWMGIVMLFLPFFGIPNTWKTAIAILIGMVLIWISLSLRRQYRSMRGIIKNLERAGMEQAIHTPDPIPSTMQPNESYHG